MTPIFNFNLNNLGYAYNPFGSLSQDISFAVQNANMQALFGTMSQINFSGGFNPFASSAFNMPAFPAMPVFNMPAFNMPAFNFSNISASVYRPSTAAASQVSMTGQRVQDALRLAESQIGVREASGHNDGARINTYRNGKANGAAWCASFVSWCYGRGQGKDNSKTFGYDASSQNIRKKAEKAGFYKKANTGYTPKAGDLVIWNNGDGTGHIGIVVKANADGTIETIEGNCGDAVKRVKRKRQGIDGFVQMNEWIAATESGSRTSYVA